MHSAKVFFFGGFLLVVIIVAVLWVSFRDCPGVFRRYYHTIVLREKDFVDPAVRFQMQGQGTLGLPNGRLGGFTTVRATDCVEVVLEGDDEGSPDEAADEMEKKVRAGHVIEQESIQRGEFAGRRTVLLTRRAAGPKLSSSSTLVAG